MEGQIQMVLMAAGIVAVVGLIVAFVIYRRRTAYLGPVKEELQKEKAWLRRGEYNAAMVKGRQNLELLLKLVAEKNGIQLDNTAQAVANAEDAERVWLEAAMEEGYEIPEPDTMDQYAGQLI